MYVVNTNNNNSNNKIIFNFLWVLFYIKSIKRKKLLDKINSIEHITFNVYFSLDYLVELDNNSNY